MNELSSLKHQLRTREAELLATARRLLPSGVRNASTLASIC